ncbi:MAG: peptide chain release factor N(5)-glutamine methyltransferase [Deltaproteobacteria bacterium]
MTIKEAITHGIDLLKTNIESAWLEGYVLLGHVLKKERVYLISHDDDLISSHEYNKFIAHVNERLKGIPLQYITGNQEFMSLNFDVNPAVLIPRPETELLVGEVLKYISNILGNNNVYILDIGAGSGCISVSLAYNSERSFITAVDISKDALKTAEHNAKKHRVKDRIFFVESDMFKNLSKRKFDVIVSNPPYIPTGIIGGLQVEVKDNEPMRALDGGNDGLDCIRQIVDSAYCFLKPGGFLALEVGHDQAQIVAALMEKQEKYENIRIVKDYSGIERIVTTHLLAPSLKIEGEIEYSS